VACRPCAQSCASVVRVLVVDAPSSSHSLHHSSSPSSPARRARRTTAAAARAPDDDDDDVRVLADVACSLSVAMAAGEEDDVNDDDVTRRVRARARGDCVDEARTLTSSSRLPAVPLARPPTSIAAARAPASPMSLLLASHTHLHRQNMRAHIVYKREISGGIRTLSLSACDEVEQRRVRAPHAHPHPRRRPRPQVPTVFENFVLKLKVGEGEAEREVELSLQDTAGQEVR